MSKARWSPNDIATIARSDVYRVLESHGAAFVLAVTAEFLREQEPQPAKRPVGRPKKKPTGDG